MIIRLVDLEVVHDGEIVHEVQPVHDQEDILPVLSVAARNDIDKALRNFYSDPTIPLANRRGGMREHADGLD
jgi:hypothetical protein